MVKKLKVGDYVEVLRGGGDAGVKPGSQGIIIDDTSNPDGHMGIMFPLRDDIWGMDRKRTTSAGYGWMMTPTKLKLVCRLR